MRPGDSRCPVGPTGVGGALSLSAADLLELTLDSLARGEPVELRVNGSCMRPWAFGGDRLRVRPLRRRPRPGDVVLIREGDLLLAHRVLCVRGDRVWTRGDLSDVADPSRELAQVLGIAVSARGRLGLAVPLDLPVLGRLALIAAPAFRLGFRLWHRARPH